MQSQVLAHYLIYLDTHPEEYAKYHAWRRDYGAVDYYTTSQGNAKAFCQICAMLHDEKRMKTRSWHHQPHRTDLECGYKKWDFEDIRTQNA